MRQAVMTSPGKIKFREAKPPVPKRGEVRLRIERIGVCGSDVHVYHGKHPFTSYPVVQGHEFSGTVEKLGPGVRGVRVGSKATFTPQEVCGKCLPCRRGDYNICDTLKVLGFQAPGVAQDLFVAEVSKLVPLPPSFTFEQGAFVEPVAVAVHCTGRAGNMKGMNVVVTGAGPIGNFVAQVARWRGARVLITDVSDFRLRIAKKCRVGNISNARREKLERAKRRVFGRAGFDIALECAGAEPAMASLISSINKGGTIMAVGVFQDKPVIDMAIVGDRELSLVGSLMYKYEDYRRAVSLIGSRRVLTRPLESKHFSFEDYPAAYRYVLRRGDKSMKVFIDL